MGTQLATMLDTTDTTSYQTMLTAHSLSTEACWIGCYYNESNSQWKWQRGDSFDWSISGSYVDFNSDDHKCCYFYPVANEIIRDWYCYDQQDFTLDSITQEPATCWACDKPDRYTYSIDIVTSSDSDAGTMSNVWFRIQGNIESTSNVNDTWTEWFSNNIFNAQNTKYSFTQQLDYVGPPIKIIILLQTSDEISIQAVGVESETYSFGTDVILDYPYGTYIYTYIHIFASAKHA